MAIRVYNTLTRTKETLETLEPGKVRLYVCGPTVYDKAHVGHAMSSVVFDIIRRYLEYRGYQVRHVMNYTDVEDKIIQRALDTGENPSELAQRYLAEYDRHLQDLNVLPPTVKPRASDEIGQIVTMVSRLVEQGYAYVVDGDVYFRVKKDPDYGKLSRRKIEDMRAGARLDVDARKEDPADFALWKSTKPGEPAWDSPWGKGRPGWHIECSAMNLRYLGEQIDIHGGGNDLVFPHHENEIAQSECYTGQPFARYWMHNGMLQLSGEKMSKSLGNLITIDEFLADHSSDAFRMIILNANYRGPLTFTEDVVQQAENALDRLRGSLRAQAASTEGAQGSNAELHQATEAAITGFEAAMDDDFNTASALAHLFELVRSLHTAVEAGAGVEAVEQAQATLRRLTGVLGLGLQANDAADGLAAPLIDLLIELRQELRSARQFELADRIRDRLTELGVNLEDGKRGTTWRVVGS
jgi:cysteinyl-tRNA synthetase